MSLVECRFNPNHKVKSSRLIIHEKKCPDRNNGRAIQSEDDPNLKIIVGSHNDSSIYNSSIKKASDSRFYEKIKQKNIEKEKETEDKFEQLRKQMYKDSKDYEQTIQNEKNNNNMFKNKKKKKNKNKNSNNNYDKENLFNVNINEIQNENKENYQFIDDKFDLDDDFKNENNNEEQSNYIRHNKNEINNKSDYENLFNEIKYDEDDFIKINTNYDPNEEFEKIIEMNKNYFMI
jgi:hypothetical protein